MGFKPILLAVAGHSVFAWSACFAVGKLLLVTHDPWHVRLPGCVCKDRVLSVSISCKSASQKVLSVFIRVHLRLQMREASFVKREAKCISSSASFASSASSAVTRSLIYHPTKWNGSEEPWIMVGQADIPFDLARVPASPGNPKARNSKSETNSKRE